MDIMQAVKERHSVRQYLEKPIEDEKRAQLSALLEKINTESGLNIEIRYDDPDGFDSRLAHYGSFKNVKNYIVLKGKDMKKFEETCGYYGEKLVLEAQMLGLNTCWAALTFNKKTVKAMVPAGERFCMVIALGYGETLGAERKSKSYKDVTITDGSEPEWFRAGVESALLAPTAMNQQRFKIEYMDGKVTWHIPHLGICLKVDLGIVKYHFDMASENAKSSH